MNLRNKSADEVASYLSETLQGISSWAKDRTVDPLKRHYPAHYTDRQEWYTNCCRFLMIRTSKGDSWRLPTNEIHSLGPAAMDLAREGIPAHMWSDDLLKQRARELVAICEKVGEHPTRRQLYDCLLKELEIARPWG